VKGPEHQKFRQEFDDAVGAVDERAHNIEHTLANLSMDADSETVGSGYRALNSSPDKVARSPEEKRRRDEYARTLREAIQRQIEANNEQIEANNIRLAELTGEASALERLLTALRRGEEADIDAQGRLRDAEAEVAIRTYERKYGVTIDRADAGQIDLVLKDVLDEMDWIRRDNERLERDNELLASEGARMDADPSHIPEFVAGTLEASGVSEVTTATFAMKSADTRLRVLTELQLDEATRATAERAITDADSFFQSSIEAPPVNGAFTNAATHAVKPEEPERAPSDPEPRNVIGKPPAAP